MNGEQPPFAPLAQQIRAHANTEKFFDPARPWTPPRDFELCMALDRFSFVLRARRFPDGLLCLERVDVP